jgi:hypothetical protein
LPRAGLIWATLFAIAIGILVVSTIVAVIKLSPVPKGFGAKSKNYYRSQWLCLTYGGSGGLALFPRVSSDRLVSLPAERISFVVQHCYKPARWILSGCSPMARVFVVGFVALLSLALFCRVRNCVPQLALRDFGCLALCAPPHFHKVLIVYAEETRLGTATGWLTAYRLAWPTAIRFRAAFWSGRCCF